MASIGRSASQWVKSITSRWLVWVIGAVLGIWGLVVWIRDEVHHHPGRGPLLIIAGLAVTLVFSFMAFHDKVSQLDGANTEITRLTGEVTTRDGQLTAVTSDRDHWRREHGLAADRNDEWALLWAKQSGQVVQFSLPEPEEAELGTEPGEE